MCSVWVAGLSLFWTSASGRGFQLSDATRLLSRNTAQLCCLDDRKGSLAPGYDADLVIWDPEREFVVCVKKTRLFTGTTSNAA